MDESAASVLFQFPPLREGRRYRQHHDSTGGEFQFPPLREGRLGLFRPVAAGELHSNSRPCERGDSRSGAVRPTAALFQFPPLREGRPSIIVRQSRSRMISIPAPARGATTGRQKLHLRRDISIPAPARGATAASRRLCRRTPISIPAPARGATRAIQFRPTSPAYFNSRPCERGDERRSKGCFITLRFQFPPLREGRPPPRGGTRWPSYFNSRPCERGDGAAQGHPGPAGISIPAPARGATCTPWAKTRTAAFQFPPLREGRLADGQRAADPGHFNSRPCERGDVPKIIFSSFFAFQFPPLREGRPPAARCTSASIAYFNSRPCERGDGLLALQRGDGGQISIPAPARGATRTQPGQKPRPSTFQFPPLREGRQAAAGGPGRH